MSDWKRSTHEVSLGQLPPNMEAEIQQHIEQYNLGDIMSTALMCIQTDSHKTNKELFGTAESTRMGAIISPRWLVWVISGTKTATTALSALLSDVVIQDYATTQFAKMVPDSGIEVSGKFTGASESVSAFIGLEENAAGKKFKQTVFGAVQNAKK